jgi:hypothetical protein
VHAVGNVEAPADKEDGGRQFFRTLLVD